MSVQLCDSLFVSSCFSDKIQGLRRQGQWNKSGFWSQRRNLWDQFTLDFGLFKGFVVNIKNIECFNL